MGWRRCRETRADPEGQYDECCDGLLRLLHGSLSFADVSTEILRMSAVRAGVQMQHGAAVSQECRGGVTNQAQRFCKSITDGRLGSTLVAMAPPGSAVQWDRGAAPVKDGRRVRALG